MQINLTKLEPKADLTVLPLFANEQPNKNRSIPFAAFSDFKNRLGNSHLVYTENGRVLLLGLGEKKDFNTAQFEHALKRKVNLHIFNKKSWSEAKKKNPGLVNSICNGIVLSGQLEVL